MKVSIVIPTYHRKDSLARLLRTIKDKAEIIVVEQEENNGAFFRSIRPIKYIYLPKKSTPHAMNVGVSKAKGDLILFLDDDVTTTPGFIQHHTNNFKDTHIAATVGRIITDGQPIQPDKRNTGHIYWLGIFSDGFSSTIRQEVDTVIGANTCWRKDVFKNLGGFDERFVGNAMRFESDLSLRAKRNGYKILFEPKALVYHHRVPTGGTRRTEGIIRWYIDYFWNETLFYIKNGSVILLPLFWLTRIYWVLTNL